MITVAGGRFAPGHLGELTRIIPFEMVDEALADTMTVQARVRDLPSRVVVYLLLAAVLFADQGYLGVWQRLIAGLDGLRVATPTGSALAQARRRIGVKPLRALFDLLRGPASGIATAGVYWHGRLVTAIDGTILTCADSTANLRQYIKQTGTHGGSGYPQVRLLALVSCGTRTIIDAVFGATLQGETTYTTQLLRSLHPGMIVLLDRNFAARTLITAMADTGADLVVRVKNSRKLPVLRRLDDGSYLSTMGTLRVRVINCEITIATTAGKQTGVYQLVTTVLDPDCPASAIITLYHERWEIETAYLELKSSILGGRVLRAQTPAGVDQEIYALLLTYQVLRIAMSDATASTPNTDPDRASFTIALNTARDLVIQAAGIIALTIIDLIGTIGRHVLANLMPDRRLRVNTRVVKRALSKYAAKGPRVRSRSYKTTININILAPPNP